MTSGIEREIYVRLLGEGTEVFRPTKGIDLGGGVFIVLPTADYDPVDETWEFPPGSRVQCETAESEQGSYLRAAKLQN
jgi:hypothetical protein